MIWQTILWAVLYLMVGVVAAAVIQHYMRRR